ncbi:SMP-30/gluconolactonase/LRE family protein [Lentzea sp. NPDC051213]|uniref:SMP-30/gluconolactonase/LRE family protein n=1 Tax=Lentzea sp. NPDC051213 TaxID=3364126 RepID=UPI0037AD6F15
MSIQGTPDLGKLDGEIRTLDPATGAVRTFATGLDNPRGLTFTGRHLVVTDTDKIFTIDRSGTVQLLATAAQFPFKAEFFNDVTAEPGGGAVYVTEMGARTKARDPQGVLWPTDSPEALQIPAEARVYRVSLTGQIRAVNTPSRKSLIINGVGLGRSGLLIADMFYGNIVRIEDGRQTVLASGFRGADGVEQAADGTIYISSFDNGAVWSIDRDGENPRTLLSGVGSRSTADFYLDERGKRLLVPDTLHGTVIVLPL